MTDQPLDSEAEFRSKLDELLINAHNSGLEINNQSYALRHQDPDVPDWDVIISRLAKQSTN